MTNRCAKLRRITALMLSFILCMLCTASLAAGYIRIISQPEDQTIAPGTTATFTIKAQGQKKLSWRVCSDNGSIDLTLKETLQRFKGMTYEGGNSKTFVLHHVPEEMDGWKVYCRLTNGNRVVNSEKAILHVTTAAYADGQQPEADADADAADEDDDDEPAADADASADADPDDEEAEPEDDDAEAPADEAEADAADADEESDHILKAIGCTITYGKQKGLSALDFSGKDSVTVKLICKGTPSYWVINGTRFDFKPVPKTITITKLKRSITIEAVKRGKKPTTLISEADILANRTGATLQVTTATGANLSHITRAGQNKGGWFKKIDFTQDYKNRATKKMEQGGRVTLRVQPSIPEGKGVCGYTFMGAIWSFNTQVVHFTAYNLRESIRFGVKYYDLPICKITCVGCTFSGGNFKNATSGWVYQGTRITVETTSTGWGRWSGLKSSGLTDNPRTSFTVHKGGSISWVPEGTP